VAALRALEGVDDPRAAQAAVAALAGADIPVALAALAVLRGWVADEAGTRVLDVLTAIAVDRTRDAQVRLAALDALSELPNDLVQPILEQAALAPQSQAMADDPLTVREWVAARAREAPLSKLHETVTRVRERERLEPSPQRRQEWLLVRGAVHAALAHRGSRVALYDLREAFDGATTPLPLDFLAAVSVIGDESCLEPMARAWATSPKELWWRSRLVEAAGDIMRRTGLGGRSAVVKRIRLKWAGFV